MGLKKISEEGPLMTAADLEDKMSPFVVGAIPDSKEAFSALLSLDNTSSTSKGLATFEFMVGKKIEV